MQARLYSHGTACLQGQLSTVTGYFTLARTLWRLTRPDIHAGSWIGPIRFVSRPEAAWPNYHELLASGGVLPPMYVFMLISLTYSLTLDYLVFKQHAFDNLFTYCCCWFFTDYYFTFLLY